MNQPTSVEAHFTEDDTLHPIAFIWQDERLTIQSTGRQWDTEGARHFLVEVAGLGVFELCYDRVEYRWLVLRTPGDFGPRKRSI